MEGGGGQHRRDYECHWRSVVRAIRPEALRAKHARHAAERKAQRAADPALREAYNAYMRAYRLRNKIPNPPRPAGGRPGNPRAEGSDMEPEKNTTTDQSEPILARPAAHPLVDCLRELKFGRPAADQEFLDDCIATWEAEKAPPAGQESQESLDVEDNPII